MAFLESFYNASIPYFLRTVMFAMGLALTLGDLKSVFARPRGIVAGLGAQLLFLPALAIGLGFLYGSPPVIAAGAIILCACPGGVTSNAYTFAARADIALSIGLTVVASMITIFTIPFLTMLALDLHLQSADVPNLSAQNMIGQLLQVTLIPVALGLGLRAWQPDFAKRLVEPLRLLALAALIVIAVVGTIIAWDRIVETIWTAGLLMATINVSAMAVGYGLGKLLRLPFPQRASITFEVGVQNLGMALFVCVTILGSPELAVATFVYAFFMKITALTFIWYVRRRLDSETGEMPAAAALANESSTNV